MNCIIMNSLNHRFKILTCLIFSTLISGASFAREITVGFGEGKPPFIMFSGGNTEVIQGVELYSGKGIEIDIFRKAFELMGHTLKVKIMPKGRLKRSLRVDNGIDAVSAVNLTQDKFFYSDKLVTFVDFAVSKASNDIELNKISDLKDYTVGTWPGAYTVLGEEFEKLYGRQGTHRHKYFQYSNQLHQNEEFWSDNLEVIILDRYIFAHYKKLLAENYPTQTTKLRFDDVFEGDVVYYAAFKDQKIRDQFNEALAVIRHNGIYQKIIDNYIR